MSEAKHTPGPWKVSMSGSYRTEVRSATGRRVAATWVQGPAKSRQGYMNQAEVNEANARLIAAAPELLEALKDVRYRLYGNGPGYLKIDAAIAKAEGRSP